jgi:hypothetical protein
LTFPFKVHQSARAIYFLAMAFLLLNSIYDVLPSEQPAVRSIGFLGLFFWTVLACVTYPQRIVIQDGEVTIRSGLWVVQRFRLTDVSRVYPSKGWPPSHTLYPVSGWRLSVGKRDLLAIPVDEMGFLEEVNRQAPHLHRYGDELRSGIDKARVTRLN